MSAPTAIDIGRLASLIRTELKLDPATPIDADTKLIGGEQDLDSLDILMLVTAIEKQFGVKIPDESIGREAFGSVGTLLAFIQERSR